MALPLIPVIIGGLAAASASIVGRVLLALGMSYVTYTGFDLLIGWVSTQIKTSIAGLPADAVAFLAWMWVDKAIGMVFSAYAAAIVVKMAGSTAITKIVTKG